MPEIQPIPQPNASGVVEASVARTDDGRCRAVNIDGQVHDVEIHPSYLPPVEIDDPVWVGLRQSGDASLISVQTEQPNAFGAQVQMSKDVVRACLPAGVKRYEIVIGDSRLEIHANGRVRIIGKSLYLDAEGLTQVVGSPLALD